MPTPTPAGWRITVQGMLWLLVTAVLVAVGIARNINLLALLGCALFALFILQAAAVGRGLRSLNIRRWTDDVLHAGASCRVELRLHNPASSPVKGLWVEDAGPEHLAGWSIGTLEAGGRRTCRSEIVPSKRGWYPLEPVRVATGHPFGLVRVVHEAAPALKLLVLPRPGKIAREKLRRYLRGSDPRGDRTRHKGTRHELARSDFHALRPYRPGDSPRWIHWRTTARRGEVMVKEFEDVPGDDLLVVLDASSHASEAFEQAVTLAASLAWEWCQRVGDKLAVAVTGQEIEEGLTSPELSRRALRVLALAEPEQGGAVNLASALRQTPRSAGVIVVSGGASTLPAVLESTLGRPVAHLDATQPMPFYTPPVTSR